MIKFVLALLLGADLANGQTTLICPTVPANTYQAYEAVPEGYNHPDLQNLKCFGSPGMSTSYAGGRYCQMKLSNISYCVKVADASCFFTLNYVANTAANNSFRNMSDQTCYNYAVCGRATCTTQPTFSYGYQCPTYPTGVYQSQISVPIGYTSSTLTNYRCWGAPLNN